MLIIIFLITSFQIFYCSSTTCKSRANFENMVRKMNRYHVPRPGYLQRLLDRMKINLIEFCQQTNLHGFQYMKHENSTTFRSLFYAAACCCSASLCLYLIALQINDNSSKSVISSITSTAYPIWKVPFPAVTICNVNVVHSSNIKAFTKIIERFQINNDTINAFLKNLKSLINFEELKDAGKYEEIFQAWNSSGYGIDQMMQMLTKPCHLMTETCFWQTLNVSCADIFTQIKTTHGYCCSFNYYGTQKFVKDLNKKEKIRYRYAKGAGSTFSLRVHLRSNVEQYISPIQNSAGFTVQVHDQFNYPDLDFISNSLEPNTIMAMSIMPKIYTSSALLRSMPIKSRNCMFENEGNLRWSSIYTFSNCMNECLTSTIFKYCNCIPFYYPVNDLTKFCTLKDVECLNRNKFNYSSLVDPTNFDISPESLKEDDSTVLDCKCYPQCNENKLEFHIDQSKKSTIVESNLSILSVFYNDMGCIKTEREIYFTWDRVLASIGGIFGLCIGGSLISILEIVYFFVNSLFFCESSKTNDNNQSLKSNTFPKLYVQNVNHHQDKPHDNDNLKKQSGMQPKIQIIFNGMNPQ